MQIRERVVAPEANDPNMSNDSISQNILTRTEHIFIHLTTEYLTKPTNQTMHDKTSKPDAQTVINILAFLYQVKSGFSPLLVSVSSI